MKNIRTLLSSACCLGLSLGLTLEVSARQTPDVLKLEVGQTQILQVSGGQKYRLPFTVKANHYIHLSVNQQGIDVALRLFSPDGKEVDTSDEPNGNQGFERVKWISAEAGTYELRIEATDSAAAAARCLVRFEALRPATELDRSVMEIDHLNEQVQRLFLEGKIDTALEVMLKGLALAEKNLPPDSEMLAQCLNNLASLYFTKGEFAKAEPVYERALAVYRQAGLQESQDALTLLQNLGTLYQELGKYNLAQPAFEQLVDLRKKVLGPDHPEVALALNRLAMLYRVQGQLDQIEPLLQQALSINEKALGPESLGVAASFNSLGMYYFSRGDLTQAVQVFERSIAIMRKGLPKNHPDFLTSYNNLAIVNDQLGNFKIAADYINQALAQAEAQFGPDHPAVALLLSTLATNRRTVGDFHQAQLYDQRAYEIRLKLFGENHKETATSLNNIGFTYYKRGDYESAEPYYRRSLAIREKVLPPNHVEIGHSYTNLAALLIAKKDYQPAKTYQEKGLQILEAALGPNHPDVANSLNNLGILYEEVNQLDLANECLHRARDIRVKVYGPEHPGVASSDNNLGIVALDRNQVDEALRLTLNSLKLRQQIFGKQHPEVAISWNNLALIKWTTGDLKAAVECQRTGNNLMERQFERNLLDGSERQKLQLVKVTANRLDQTVTLHTQALPGDVSATEMAMELILQRKGRVLDAMAEGVEALRRRATPEDQKLLDDLTSARAQLSALSLRGPGKLKLEDFQAKSQALERQIDELERAISARSAEFRAQAQPVTLEAIQRVIPKDALLVEYIAYRKFDLKTRKSGDLAYAVYLLGHDGPPQWVPLGDAAPIDAAVTAFRKALKTRKTDLKKALKPVSQKLDQLIFKPVRQLTKDKRQLLISPDGVLQLIPFAALMDDQGQYAVERYAISYLTSGRDLLRLQVNIPSVDPPFIVADPDYGTGAGPTLSGTTFQPLERLAATAIEGRQIQTLFPDAKLNTQDQAVERALKSVKSPALLHIATHGYFLPDLAPADPGADDSRTLTKTQDLEAVNVNQLRLANPLLRSGLFLADANQGSATGEDATLTALEMTGLPLWGTKLVVLSACETGVGEIRNGEGVFGLRRALVLAGSETQMMSLWSVSDRGTQELMARYYQRLKNGEGRAEALRNVQLAMMKDSRWAHPFYWSSFIISGEWKPL